MIKPQIPAPYVSKAIDLISLWVPAGVQAGERVYFTAPASRQHLPVQRVFLFTSPPGIIPIPYYLGTTATFVAPNGDVLLEGIPLVRLFGGLSLQQRFPFSLAGLCIDWQRSYVRGFAGTASPLNLVFHADYEPATR